MKEILGFLVGFLIGSLVICRWETIVAWKEQHSLKKELFLFGI